MSYYTRMSQRSHDYDSDRSSDSLSAGRMNADELADAANLSRRAIRFYVQQKLLPAPHGLGRGKHYDQSHLDRLRRIAELQSAGHSLEAIRQILAGRTDVAPPGKPVAINGSGSGRAKLTAELWTRLRLADGVEIHIDATKHNPT